MIERGQAGQPQGGQELTLFQGKLNLSSDAKALPGNYAVSVTSVAGPVGNRPGPGETAASQSRFPPPPSLGRVSFQRRGPQAVGIEKWKEVAAVESLEEPGAETARRSESLFQLNRRVFKAYLLKESLEPLWDYRYEGAMLNYLRKWLDQLRWQRLPSFQKLAGMLLVRLGTGDDLAGRGGRADRGRTLSGGRSEQNFDSGGLSVRE